MATTRASEMAELACNYLVANGAHQSEPVLIGTDNSANLSIAMDTATPSRIKPHLKKWTALKARIRRGIVTVAKVCTTQMPVDFMTKWLSKKKVEEGNAYLTNVAHRVKV